MNLYKTPNDVYTHKIKASNYTRMKLYIRVLWLDIVVDAFIMGVVPSVKNGLHTNCIRVWTQNEQIGGNSVRFVS